MDISPHEYSGSLGQEDGATVASLTSVNANHVLLFGLDNSDYLILLTDLTDRFWYFHMLQQKSGALLLNRFPEVHAAGRHGPYGVLAGQQ